MKKITMTLVILLTLTMGAFAQGGLFGKGQTRDGNDFANNRDGFINLPSDHDLTGDQSAPLGSGTVLLLGLGAAYLATKKNRKE